MIWRLPLVAVSRCQLGRIGRSLTVRSVSTLIVGDGDLSFGSYYASDCRSPDERVLVSVLEESAAHESVYNDHAENVKVIEGGEGCRVMFGVDATRLEESFEEGKKFDRVIWNFPHWPGKTNIRRNRELLEAFFASVGGFLEEDGCVRIALVKGQGGMSSDTPREWKASWKVAAYAAERDLLLVEVEKFKGEAEKYQQSSHRGVDRAFHIGDEPEVYVLKPEGCVPEDIQLCTFHELHVLERRDLAEVEELARRVVPEGVEVLVEFVEFLDEVHTSVFRISYSGVSVCVDKGKGDEWRERLEEKAEEEGWRLREEKKGRGVSHVNPRRMVRLRFGR